MPDTLPLARAALAEHRPEDALRFIRFALEYPRDPGPLGPWAECLADAARALGDEAMAVRADRVATDGDAEALFDLGWGLVAAGLCGPAATLLATANRLRPHEPAIVLELATALEHAGANAAAAALLAEEAALRADRFDARYLYAFNALMAGDRVGAKRAHRELCAREDEERAASARIGSMLQRAAAVAEVTALDTEDLRGWHYVLTGGILLHLAPEPPGAKLRGRYGLRQDTEALCLEGILRMRRLLGFLSLEPEILYALPGRDTAIFVSAASKLLRMPIETWSPDAKRPGLVVAYDLGALEPAVRVALRLRRKGQPLWAHTLSWTEPVGVAPEFATSLHQANMSPWGPRLARDAAGEVVRLPPRAGSIDELAARTLAAGVDDLPGQSAIEALAQAGDVPAAGWRSRAQRDPLWFMGPVKSDRLY
jgi:hypothetical protein